jgi:hypothetical protein
MEDLWVQPYKEYWVPVETQFGESLQGFQLALRGGGLEILDLKPGEWPLASSYAWALNPSLRTLSFYQVGERKAQCQQNCFLAQIEAFGGGLAQPAFGGGPPSLMRGESYFGEPSPWLGVCNCISRKLKGRLLFLLCSKTNPILSEGKPK